MCVCVYVCVCKPHKIMHNLYENISLTNFDYKY